MREEERKMEGKQVSDRVPRYSEARLYNNAATTRTTARRVSSRNYVSSERAQIGRKKTREAYSACAPIYARARERAGIPFSKSENVHVEYVCIARAHRCSAAIYACPRRSLFSSRAFVFARGIGEKGLVMHYSHFYSWKSLSSREYIAAGGERLDDSSKVSCPAVALLCRSIERERVCWRFSHLILSDE